MLNAKNQKKTSTVLCFTSTVLQFRVCFSDINCCLSVYVSLQVNINPKGKTCTPKRRASECSVSHQLPSVCLQCFVSKPSASHQLPSVCFVSFCLDLVEIKHMHKNANKVVSCRFENNMQNVQTFPNLQLQIYKKIAGKLCPPLDLYAVRRQDLPRKTKRKPSLSVCCMNSYGSSCSCFLSESCCATCSPHGC